MRPSLGSGQPRHRSGIMRRAYAGQNWTFRKPARPGLPCSRPAKPALPSPTPLAKKTALPTGCSGTGRGWPWATIDNDGMVGRLLLRTGTPNALFKNLGNWKFTNVTRQAGLERPGKFFRGAVFADVNGDGWLDLLISTTGQGVLCYLNDGQGHFADATAAAGNRQPLRQRHARPGGHRWERDSGPVHCEQSHQRHPRPRPGGDRHAQRAVGHSRRRSRIDSSSCKDGSTNLANRTNCC